MKDKYEWDDGGYNRVVLNKTDLSGMVGNWHEGGYMTPISTANIAKGTERKNMDGWLYSWDPININKEQLFAQIETAARELLGIKP